MKKMAVIFMIATGIFIVATASSGGESEMRNYYNDYLTMKINNCKQTASAFHGACSNSRMKELMELRAAQATFYEKNRAELVETMLSNGVEKKTYKMDYFLIKYFKQSNGVEKKAHKMDYFLINQLKQSEN